MHGITAVKIGLKHVSENIHSTDNKLVQTMTKVVTFSIFRLDFKTIMRRHRWICGITAHILQICCTMTATGLIISWA